MTTDAARARIARIDELVIEAVDEGLFYDDAVKAHVFAGLGDADEAVEVNLGTFAPPEDHKDKWAWRKGVEERVAASPRGTWAALGPDRGVFSVALSDGTGKLAVGGSHDHHRVVPSFATLWERVVSYEIYTARHRIRHEQEVADNLADVATYGIAVGNTYKGIEITGGTLSSASVSSIDIEGGIALVGRKRGSPKTYSIKVAATDLVRMLGDRIRPVGPVATAVAARPTMTDAEVAERADVAAELLEVMRSGDPRTGPAAALDLPRVSKRDREWLVRHLGLVREHLPSGDAPWDGTVTRRVADQTRQVRHDEHGAIAYECRNALLECAALRLAHAVVSGRPQDVRDASELSLLEVAGRATSAMAEAVRARIHHRGIVDPAPVAEVTFRFPWARGADGRRGAVGTAPTWSTGAVVPRVTAPDDAPIACVLHPSRGGPGLAVRVLDGTCLRPVLAPGSWEPVTVDAFSRAAAEGAPWGDDPFAPVHGDLPLVAVDETCAPEPRRLGEAALRRRDATLSERLEALGPLHVIDGVVYRSCPPPRLFLATMPDGGHRMAWTIPGHLHSETDMCALRHGNALVRTHCSGHLVSASHVETYRGDLMAPLDRADHLADVLAVRTGFGAQVPRARFELLDGVPLPAEPELPYLAMDQMVHLLRGETFVDDAGLGAAYHHAAMAVHDLRVGREPGPCPDLVVGPDVTVAAGLDRAAAAASMAAVVAWARAGADLRAEPGAPELADLAF